MQADKKKKESMSMWKIILIVNLAVYILSFVIPSGAYQRDGKMAVPGTYEVVEKTYLNPVDVILAVGDTVYSSFGKLFVTLIIMGGMMGIVNSTGVLDRALGNLIHRLKDKALAIIPIYVFATALLGCVGSMISTVILFVPLGLLIARKLRADRTFAVGLVILGSFTGFMSSPINPLTGVMGQEIAGLVPYSGAGLRTIVTILNVAVVSAYLVWWAKRCQKNTAIYEADFGGEEDVESGEYENTYKPLSGREMAILAIFFGAFIFFAAGGPTLGLGMTQLGSIMLPVAFVEGILAGYSLDDTMKNFVKGTQSMCGVMVFMVLASIMSIILNQAGVLDSIVYYISIPLSHLSSAMAAVGMVIANAFINVFIGSGSGQTVVAMPIMAPLADVVGVTRQMAVLTLQYGDGFTNLFLPTNVNLMACLAMAGVDFKRWMKFLVPCYAILFVIMVASIFIGTAIGF